MRCPYDGSTLKIRGISYVCPRCSYKKVKPDKFWIPECHIKVSFPLDYAWTTFTTTDAIINGETVSIAGGATNALIVSPQLANQTRSTTQLLDFYKVKIDKITSTENSGRVLFYASNDGGTNWVRLKNNGHTKELNHGNESPAQTKYNDLRISIKLERNNASDTSPTISLFKILHDKKPDSQRTV